MANSVETYKLQWDKTGEKFVEAGVDHVVLYTEANYSKATAWNGVTGITQSPSGADPNDIYADNIKYITLRSAETFGGSISAYQSPPEFDLCDGTAEIATGVTIGQQTRKTFGLCYRTSVGDDVNGLDAGYKYHMIYGATASPSDRSYSTINDSPDPIELSWEITTTPVQVPGYKPTASLEIDSRKADDTKLKALLKVLYGYESTEGRLPLPSEIITMMAAG